MTPRYHCYPGEPERLSQALAGWQWPRSRAELPITWQLGAESLILRELTPADGDALVQAYAELSDRTIYLRFMRAKRRPSAEQVAAFTQFSPEQQCSLLLCDSAGLPVAHAQSIRRVRQSGRAEFSCLLADRYQGRGIGRRLLLALALLARSEGVSEWLADVLAENRPMLQLLHHLGLPLSLVTGRSMVFVRLDLTVLDPWLGASTKGE